MLQSYQNVVHFVDVVFYFADLELKAVDKDRKIILRKYLQSSSNLIYSPSTFIESHVYYNLRRTVQSVLKVM